MIETSTNRFLQKALDSRSGPYVWLLKNHAEIAAAIAAQARPSWKALAKAAADDGNLFAPNTLRKAWLRLERDLARAGGSPPLPTAKTPPPSPPDPPPTAEPDTETRTNHGFALGIIQKTSD